MEVDLKTKLTDEFRGFSAKLNGRKNSKTQNKREDAFLAFQNLSIPTMKQEEWRFTNAGFLNKINFELSKENPDSNITIEDIEPFMIRDLKNNHIVFINGKYSEKLSKLNFLKDGIIIEKFADAEKRKSHSFDKYLGEVSDFSKDYFTAMNTAFAYDGIYINIPDGMFVTEPIHIMYINDTRMGPVISNPRNLIIIGQCCQIKFVETYHTIGEKPSFTNMVSEVVMKFASNVEFNKIQNDKGDSYYIGTTQVRQAKDSSLNSSTITLNGKFIRNNLNSIFVEENAEANFNGFYYMRDDDFVDNHTLIDHAVPNCLSNELYKGILDNNAKAVFNGKVIVRQDAQKTNAFQTNKNILLSDGAKINTKPQLEIFADDVKCSHGATTGYLNKDAMFYMSSRGISEEMAKSLLLNAFASDILEKIKISELRDDIKRQVADRLTVDDIYFCDVLGDMLISEK